MEEMGQVQNLKFFLSKSTARINFVLQQTAGFGTSCPLVEHVSKSRTPYLN